MIFEFPEDFLLEVIKKALAKLENEDLLEILNPGGEQVEDCESECSDETPTETV